MKVLVGYAMRSGSTLLAHVLGGHSRVRAYGDLSSVAAVPRLTRRCEDTLVVKPPDLVFLSPRVCPERWFDRGVWLTRDPRDSYLSTVESGYAYLFRRRGAMCHGIDTGLLERWARIHRRYLDNPDAWHLVRYEDLTREPEATLRRLLDYLELPAETLLPFQWRRRDWLQGGDYKIARTRNISARGVGRHRAELDGPQRRVFAEQIGAEMDAMGYGGAAPGAA